MRLWPGLIFVGFGVMLTMNAVFIYLAVSFDDPVDPTYATERE